eukprot:GHUV01038389.1.p1 GENE.GHUV01038389.1~~GHUV01038389.1.p1  ORF type:complete len:101 (+),score=6.54 GHUV01038389.1:239-541(+)
MRQHLLAFKIASEALGGVGKQEVLLHWAAAKISASPAVPDDRLKQEIAAKMSQIERPRYAHLAAHAQVMHSVLSRYCQGFHKFCIRKLELSYTYVRRRAP